MEVRIADRHGFCFGVKRAVECVLELKGEVNTLGPLIHNPQFVKYLESRGIKAVDSIDQVDSDKVVIRTHGVPDRLLKEIKAKGLQVLDLTCPFVKKVQDYAKELESKGYQVIIVGQKGHPEVEAIKQNLEGGIIVDDLKDARKMPHFKKIGVVAQTTQKLGHFIEISDELKQHADEVRLINTICNATQERQSAALDLAKEVDIMIVIGGHNSANTRQLAALCSSVVMTKHIETGAEIDEAWFRGKAVAGITAGASTPDSVIKKAIEKIRLIQ